MTLTSNTTLGQVGPGTNGCFYYTQRTRYSSLDAVCLIARTPLF